MEANADVRFRVRQRSAYTTDMSPTVTPSTSSSYSFSSSPSSPRKSLLPPPPASSSAVPIKPIRTIPSEDLEDLLPWPAARDSNSVRNRRRSRGHLVAITAHGRVGSISETLSSAETTPTRIIPTSRAMTDADMTLPLLSPTAPSAAAQLSPDRPYLPGQPKSLSGIATRAFCLGIALATGVISAAALIIFTSTPLWRLPFFLAALSTFHFLEFWTTAAYNTRAAEVGSFLLTANWPGYAVAHAFAFAECLIVGLLFPRRSLVSYVLPFPGVNTVLVLVGLVLVLVGQTVRTAAMAQAGPSFNHHVQQYKSPEHVLVTTGIYARLRHPSYFGFFWWALGTQMVLGNPVCFLLYAFVLWRFFSSRVRSEEVWLVKFFRDEYVDYKKKVGTKIPFIR